MSAVAGPREMGLSQRETFGHTLVELANENDRVVVLDGDLGTSTRTDIFADAHPSRFLQMGIAEQNMVGVAAGLATLGWIPFVTTFACFAVYRALDPIRVLVAQPSLNVKIAGGYSGLLTGMTGKTHQVVDDIAVMRAMPHMTVIVPGDEEETRAAIRATAEQRGPVYLRLTRDPSPRLFDSDYRFELGRTHLLREGGDVGLISTGTQTARALEAAELLAADGHRGGGSPRPHDQAARRRCARRVRVRRAADRHHRGPHRPRRAWRRRRRGAWPAPSSADPPPRDR